VSADSKALVLLVGVPCTSISASLYRSWREEVGEHPLRRLAELLSSIGEKIKDPVDHRQHMNAACIGIGWIAYPGCLSAAQHHHSVFNFANCLLPFLVYCHGVPKIITNKAVSRITHRATTTINNMQLLLGIHTQNHTP
jgi:hypothetical protein